MVDLIKKTVRGTRRSNRIRYQEVTESKLFLLGGNDSITVSNLAFSTIDGGAGQDTLTLISKNAYDYGIDFFYSNSIWSVAVPQSGSEFKESTLKSVERVVVKSQASDKEGIIYKLVTPPRNSSNPARLEIQGTSGNNKLLVADKSTNVVVNAGRGDDVININVSGKSTIDGGDGNDRVVAADSSVSRLYKEGSDWLLEGYDIFGVPDNTKVTRLINVETLQLGSTLLNFNIPGITGAEIYSASLSSPARLRGTEADDRFLIGPNGEVDFTAGGKDVVRFTTSRFNTTTKPSTIGIQQFKNNDDIIDWSEFSAAKLSSPLKYDADGYATGQYTLTLGAGFAPITLVFFA